MAETMYDAPGIGLAAPQVGSLIRVCVVDVGDPEDETGEVRRLYKLVNPTIVAKEGKEESEEGCLSIPSVRENVTRAEKIIVEALDENGKQLRLEADGLFAVCLQHEIDHLDGILFIDHLSRLKQQLIKSKLRKLER
jgi:peptide deformylase